jgi:hypothetical protein
LCGFANGSFSTAAVRRWRRARREVSRSHPGLPMPAFRPMSNTRYEPRNSTYNNGPYYLGFEEIMGEEVLGVHLGLHTRVKWKGWFAKRGLRHYKWMESFAEELHQDASSEVFFEKIGWNFLEAEIRVQANASKFDVAAAQKRLAGKLRTGGPHTDPPVGDH